MTAFQQAYWLHGNSLLHVTPTGAFWHTSVYTVGLPLSSFASHFILLVEQSC